MTAPDAAALVDEFTPLALSVAARWGRRFPWLADDFTSDGALALWKAACNHRSEGSTFGARVRVLVNFACIERLRIERRRNPLVFRPQLTASSHGQDRDPLDLAVAAREMPVGAELEVADLLDRLPAERRAEVVEHFFGGLTLVEMGTARGVTRAAMSLRVRGSVRRLAVSG